MGALSIYYTWFGLNLGFSSDKGKEPCPLRLLLGGCRQLRSSQLSSLSAGRITTYFAYVQVQESFLIPLQMNLHSKAPLVLFWLYSTRYLLSEAPVKTSVGKALKLRLIPAARLRWPGGASASTRLLHRADQEEELPKAH